MKKSKSTITRSKLISDTNKLSEKAQAASDYRLSVYSNRPEKWRESKAGQFYINVGDAMQEAADQLKSISTRLGEIRE